MCVNNLPKVVTWQRLDRELNSRPLESQANALTITPSGHTFVGACRKSLHLEEIIADHFQYMFLVPFPMLTYIRTYAIS